MAIFNEQYLQEMKTKEEYRRKSFKKKYNFKPSKDNKDIGTINVDGKDIEVDMGKNKIVSMAGGKMLRQQTMADMNSKNNKIILDDKFFKLKGSNKNKRRDAYLQHEIGHSRLHGVSADNDKKNPNVYKDALSNTFKDQGHNSDFSKVLANVVYNQFGDDYEKNADKSKYKDREAVYNKAKKYDTGNAHAHAHEFEADRYSVNKTSASALKRGLRNYNKLTTTNKETKSLLKDEKKYARPGLNINNDIIHNVRKANHILQKKDYESRVKALKDKDLQNEKLYK